VTDDAAAKYLGQDGHPSRSLPSRTRCLPKFYLGIVVSKSDTKLQQAMLQATRELQQDGTYGKVLAKWNISELGLKPRRHQPGDPSHPLANPKP